MSVFSLQLLYRFWGATEVVMRGEGRKTPDSASEKCRREITVDNNNKILGARGGVWVTTTHYVTWGEDRGRKTIDNSAR